LVTTRVARWGALGVLNCVSKRPRLTVSRPERARRRSTVEVTTVFAVTHYRCRRSGYLSRLLLLTFDRRVLCCGRACRRSRLLRRGLRRRLHAGRGRGEHWRTASVGGHTGRRRRTPSPVRGSKSRSSSSRPPLSGIARPASAARRATARASFFCYGF
jgi:hypothetical protein